MSAKPNPVALTAAMLMAAHYCKFPTLASDGSTARCYNTAQLASSIHRLAPACKRLAEAECNGEWRDGQRRAVQNWNESGEHVGELCKDLNRTAVARLDKSIADYATRLDKRVAKLNAQLAPFGYILIRQGDPRGAMLVLATMPIDDSTIHYAIG